MQSNHLKLSSFLSVTSSRRSNVQATRLFPVPVSPKSINPFSPYCHCIASRSCAAGNLLRSLCRYSGGQTLSNCSSFLISRHPWHSWLYLPAERLFDSCSHSLRQC